MRPTSEPAPKAKNGPKRGFKPNLRHAIPEFRPTGQTVDAKLYDVRRMGMLKAQERKLQDSMPLRQRVFEYKNLLGSMKIEPSPYVRDLAAKLQHEKAKVVEKSRPEVKRRLQEEDRPAFVSEQQKEMWRQREGKIRAQKARLAQQAEERKRRDAKLQVRKEQSQKYGLRTPKGQPIMSVRMDTLLSRVQRTVSKP